MRKILAVFLVFLALPLAAAAQEYPKAEIFGGYSYFKANTDGVGLNGWDASVAIAKALNLPPDIVLRKIGLLPPQSDERSPNADEMVSLFSSLGEEDQDELLQMARLKLERKKRGARGKKSGA